MSGSGLVTGALVVFAGLFAICGAAFDWDFFMNHRKARFFVNLFGRGGARIFYAAFGLVFIVFGVLVALGVVKDKEQRGRFGAVSPFAQTELVADCTSRICRP